MVGAFVHERVGGQLVNRGMARRTGWGRAGLASALPVVFGPLQVAVEASVPARNVATQRRFTVQMDEPAGLALSDLLLGVGARARGTPRTRDDIVMVARADSLPTLGEPLALYWEIYGMTADSLDRVAYTVTLTATAVAGGRALGAEVLRGVGRALRLGDGGQRELSWEEIRPAGATYQAEYVVLRLDERPGSVRLRIRVRESRSGREAQTGERVVTLVRVEDVP